MSRGAKRARREDCTVPVRDVLHRAQRTVTTSLAPVRARHPRIRTPDDHWNKQQKNGLAWEPRYDETIRTQAKAYLELLKGSRPEFIPEQAEDFCFAFVFGYITADEGEKRWPALRGHESDRIIEMQEMLQNAKTGKNITSKDHRVVQAIAMWSKVNKTKVNIFYPSAVEKSWPQFWDFINEKN